MTHLYAIRSNWRRQIFAESDRRAIMHNIDDVLARQNEQTSAQQVVDKFTQYISRSIGPGKAEDFVLRRTRGQRVESVHGSSPTTVHGYPPEWEIQISKPWNDTAAGGSHYTGDWHFDQEGELEGATTSIVFSAILWDPSEWTLGTEVHDGNRFQSSTTEPRMFFSGSPAPVDQLNVRNLQNGEIFPASYMYHRAPTNLSQRSHYYTTNRYTAQVTFQFADPQCTIHNESTGRTATMLHECPLRI